MRFTPITPSADFLLSNVNVLHILRTAGPYSATRVPAMSLLGIVDQQTSIEYYLSSKFVFIFALPRI